MKRDYMTLDHLYAIIDLVLESMEGSMAIANEDPNKHDMYFIKRDTVINRVMRRCRGEIQRNDEIKFSGLKHAISYKLNYAGYYSIGNSLYVKIDAINSVAVLDIVITNSKEDVAGRSLALERKKKLRENVISGQIAMVFDNSNMLDRLEEQTNSEEEFLDCLEDYAM